MAVSSSSVQLILFLFCTSYQYHALLASTAPSSSHTSGHDNDDAVPVPVPAIYFFHDAPPPLWSKAKGWPAEHVFSSGTLPKYKGSGSHHLNMHTDANSSNACGDNCTSRTVGEGTMNHVSSASAAPVTSNGTTGELPPLHQHQEQGVHLRRRKNGAAAIKTRKPPGVYHRTARLLQDRTDCKFGAGNGVVVVASSAALLVLLCNLAVAGLLLRCMHRKRRGEISAAAVDLDDDDKPVLRPELLRQVTGPLRYSYRMLVTATSNFAESNRIGRGGFGSVYGGYLHNQDRHVAIKMFSADMGSPELGSREFEAEVKVMSGLRHRNLVQLVGWCDRQRHLLLVYELVPGGGLDKHLHDPERLLTWAERYRITLGLGSAILYLHTECDQCVVHGDIKTSNVMLDSSRDAKLGDFGLARLVPHGDEPQTTEVVAGTVGYMDPEFVASQKRGTESDIYSFGVVLLEIACGRRPASSGQRKEASMLLKRVRDMYDRNAILDAADGRLNGEFDERQMERVLVTGLWCAHRERCRRPSIAQAMSVLRSDGNTVLPVLPESHGCGLVFRSFEEQAYGDLSAESDGSMGSSAATAYDTPEDSSCPLGEDS